jgi:hypothetical protein
MENLTCMLPLVYYHFQILQLFSKYKKVLVLTLLVSLLILFPELVPEESTAEEKDSLRYKRFNKKIWDRKALVLF